MKILAVDAEPVLGLGNVRMQRLGGTVVLAGPNGGGKTRVLKLIESLVKDRSDVFDVGLVSDGLTLSDDEGAYHNQAVLFVPKNTSILGYVKRTLHQLSEGARKASGLGVAHLQESTVPYIRELQSRFLTATHPDFARDDPEAVSDYKELKALVSLLLGTDLSRKGEEPALFGFALHEGHLSDGQVILLQLIVALHAQKAKLGKVVLLLDEPETHLHPAALLDVLDRVRAANPDGQLWIATHSLSVLAWAGHEAIWYVTNGTVSWAGKEPEKVLTSLLGDDEQLGRLGALLGLPAQMASNRFAAECLLPPAVVETGPGDPQLLQIRAEVKARAHDGKVRVLDYGAGKGRLAASLAELREGAELAVDYLAFEPGEDVACRAALEGAVAKAFGEAEAARRIFTSLAELGKVDAGSVDVVVLCNALHEIPAHQWIAALGADSSIVALLRQDGCLLVVEDLHIPTGEKAHKDGFLLLGEPELRKLFGVTEAGPQIRIALDPKGRLAAYLIPATLLRNVTTTTRNAALKMLKDSSRDEVKKLRTKPSSYRNGELHGLYSQLFTNACLALEELS